MNVFTSYSVSNRYLSARGLHQLKKNLISTTLPKLFVDNELRPSFSFNNFISPAEPSQTICFVPKTFLIFVHWMQRRYLYEPYA
jgi:hypothetical protein